MLRRARFVLHQEGIIRHVKDTPSKWIWSEGLVKYEFVHHI